MPNNNDLKMISTKRLKSAEILINASDWSGAALMLGLSLECALKAVICKKLNLDVYPEKTGKKSVDTFFMTHAFDQLLLVSGLDNLFGTRGPSDTSWSWSQFMNDFEGEWWNLKYDPTKTNYWNEEIVKKRHNNLVDNPGGIITEIKRRRLW